MANLERVEHQCDILVVGAGLAGCMAAWRAGQLNQSVILVDKSNPERSGCAATGIDHIWGYFPEVQAQEGVSMEDMIEDHTANIARGLVNRPMLEYLCQTALDRILDLERMGLKVRYEDSTLPGHFRLQYQLHKSRNTLHFDGRNTKRQMTLAVRQQGVTIADRVTVTDLLMEDGQVAGIVGYGTRDGKLHLFRAKAVIMACGRMNRLYRTPVGIPFTTRMPPTNTGGGKAAMFRAGAELINMEFSSAPGRWASKNFVRGGGLPANSYQPAGVAVDASGKVIADRFHERDGEWAGFVGRAPINRGYTETLSSGRGPVYADMSWGSDADQAYMRWSISNEGGGWALNHIMDIYGLDYRSTKIEMAPGDTEHEGTAASGAYVGDRCETNLPGLYAAGDEAGGLPWSTAPGALVMGYLAAESAAGHASQMSAVPVGSGEDATVQFCADILSRGTGDSWQDAQSFVEYANTFYNVEARSETMARRGLEYMAYLRKNMRLAAATPHEMTHCLEIRDLVECSEIILRSTIERTESRYNLLRRMDYPERDDANWLCFLGQRLEGDQVTFRKIRPH